MSKYPYLNFEVESGEVDFELPYYSSSPRACMVVEFNYSLKETE